MKGDVQAFLFVIVAFLIVLFLVVALLVLFGGDATEQFKCAFGMFQFTGCPGAN